MTFKLLIILLLILNSMITNAQEHVILLTHSSNLNVPIKSWKTLRDQNIVKQDLDYSCGASSIATILRHYYQQNISEADVLKAINKEDMASFADMARALNHFGFKAQGFSASFEQLAKLRIPVVIYVKHRKNDHFSVLKGINQYTVLLADPSLGNRTYSKEQFLQMWNISDNATNTLQGKFLAIIPINSNFIKADNYFNNQPLRYSYNAVGNLNFRYIP